VIPRLADQTVHMRVLLKLVLDCEPDDAWRALQDPAVFASVAGPITAFRSLEPGGFPDQWMPGEHHVAGRLFGVVPVGEQVIDLAMSEQPGGVRMLKDTGGAVSGPIAAITEWEHTMVVSSAGRGRTLYRDRLVFEVGGVSALAWPVFWAYWQWRALRLKTLAPTWKYAA